METETVDIWRQTLREVSRILGFTHKDFNRSEYALLSDVVEQVLNILNHVPLFVAKYPVGIETHVEETMKLLDIDNKDETRIVAIVGMDGIGKTSIAAATFNRIYRSFRIRYSFITCNTGDQWGRPRDVVTLQEQLLRDITGKNYHIQNSRHGTNLIERVKRSGAMLLVLDDVQTDEEQFDQLAGRLDQFHPGSRIIITIRNQRMLHNICRGTRLNCSTYSPEPLDETRSLELFGYHAFGQYGMAPDFLFSLSKEVAKMAGGLPLALEVLGSYFSWCMDKSEWWERIKLVPQLFATDHNVGLRSSSYDLLDDVEKSMYLHVALFFNGKGKDFAMEMWEDCGFVPIPRLDHMKTMSIISFDEDEEMRMHVVYQKIGEFIDKKHPFVSILGKTKNWTRQKIIRLATSNTQVTGYTNVFSRDDKSKPREEFQLELAVVLSNSSINLRISRILNSCHAEKESAAASSIIKFIFQILALLL